MTQDNDKKPRPLGLSPAQVVGSALAAMSVAFFASVAGTTGTIIGAAVGSVIATVGAATYTWSLQRTSEAARRTAELVRQRALAAGTLPRPAARRTGQPAVDEPAGDEQPDEDVPDRRWDLPWLKLALASVAVMVVGMAGITAVEAVTGKPIASLFGRDVGTGTTVGHLGGTDTGSTKHEAPRHQTPATPAPSPSEQPSQEPEPQPQPQPSETPEPTPPVTTPGVPAPSASPVPDVGQQP